MRTNPPIDLPTQPWLVQRLGRPFASDNILANGNPFAFGGGLPNGGLSREAMALLRGIWEFEYMGAAEFEFGAVPKALQQIAKADDLTTFDLTIKLTDVRKGWREKNPPAKGATAVVYVICREPHRAGVEQFIRADAAGKASLKEWTNLATVLRPDDDYDRRTCGWLELDNGFLFFTDETMFAKAADLFGVDVAVAS